MLELRDQLQATLGASYAVQRELGGGGMSRVFVARDLALGRDVVVKILHPELAATVSVERFRREIMVAAGLQHPHVIGVLGAGEIDGLPYFTMPFVDGESLRARLSREHRLPVSDVVSILRDVARALAYAHERGIVHRDIKPDNILLSHGAAAVSDFGVAKAIATARQGDGPRHAHAGTITIVGTSLGTPEYMAPEQAAGDPAVDGRADIYALGITAYEMLAGTTPFRGRALHQLLAAHLSETPAPVAAHRADVPRALAELVERCLAKDADHRPQSAAELVAALADPDVVSGAFASVTPRTAAAALAGTDSWWGSLRRRPAFLAAAALCVVAGGAAGAMLLARPDARVAAAAASGPAVTQSGGPRAADRRSIAVLPFVNIGRDTNDAYLADGLTAELSAALGRVRGLAVASPTAVASMRERPSSLAELGSALHVGMLLEGTVQRQGGRLRVTARLVNAADGFMLWSDAQEHPVKDVFAAQDGITRSIVEALGAELAMEDAGAPGVDLGSPPRPPAAPGTARPTAGEEPVPAGRPAPLASARPGATAGRVAVAPAPAAPPEATPGSTRRMTIVRVGPELPPLRGTADAEAYDAWLRGRHLVQRRDEAALREAVRQFRTAIARDSSFALAWAGVAEAYATLPLRGRAPADSTMPLAIAAAERAVALAPTRPDVVVSRARTHAAAWRWREAEADYRRALALAPRDPSVHRGLGLLLVQNGRIAEGLAELKAAASLDPLSPQVASAHAYALALAGRHADGMARARAALALDSTLFAPRYALGLGQLLAGRPADAVRTLEAALLLDPDGGITTMGALGQAYAAAGDVEHARIYLAQLLAWSARRNAAASLARIYLGLGDRAQGLVWLRRSAERRDPVWLSWSLAEPTFDPLRRELHFAEIVRRAGLDGRLAR
jgi:serine/threonine-protein kinase